MTQVRLVREWQARYPGAESDKSQYWPIPPFTLLFLVKAAEDDNPVEQSGYCTNYERTSYIFRHRFLPIEPTKIILSYILIYVNRTILKNWELILWKTEGIAK
jgi:hypothetical protein